MRQVKVNRCGYVRKVKEKTIDSRTPIEAIPCLATEPVTESTPGDVESFYTLEIKEGIVIPTAADTVSVVVYPPLGVIESRIVKNQGIYSESPVHLRSVVIEGVSRRTEGKGIITTASSNRTYLFKVTDYGSRCVEVRCYGQVETDRRAGVL